MTPTAPDAILAHERVHVRQYEDACLLGLALGIATSPANVWLGLAFWLLGGPVFLAPGFLAAWLRGGRPYEDAEHERAARQ